MSFTYRPEVLEQLRDLGVIPKSGSSPAVAARFVMALYRYELRRLRTRLEQGEFPKAVYADRVLALRRRYPLVSVPVREWTVPGTPSESEDVPIC